MIETVLAIGIIVLIFIVLSFALDKEHYLLKLFFLLSALTLIIFIPKSVLDDECYPVVINATVVGDTTTYDYGTECIQNTTSSTQGDLFKQYTWIYRVIWIYILIFIFHQVYSRKDLIRAKIRKWKK